LIEQLLCKDPNYRLGSSRLGAASIKSHPWFNNINWNDILEKKTDGPIAPDVSVKQNDDIWFHYLRTLQEPAPEKTVDYGTIFANF